MNTSRNYLLLMLFVSLLSGGLWAQGGVPPILEDEELTNLLQLTPEQTAQLEALEAENKAKMDNLRKEGAAVRNEARAARRAHKDGISSILTDEQQSQLQAYRQEQRVERHEEMKSVDWEGMREELKAYKEATIDPVMRAQRAKLDRKLAKDDREALASLRETLKNTRREQRATREEEQAPEQMEDGEGMPPSPAAKQGRRPGRRGKGSSEGPRGNMDTDTRASLEAMEVKYADDINALFEEVAPQREVWEAAQDEIRAKYLPERPNRSGERPEMGDEKVVQRNIGFLLMNPEK